jgi:hypothetical protein
MSNTKHIKGGGETSDSDRVFVELAYERFLEPRLDVASSEYENLHKAFIDKTLEYSLLASAKAAAGPTFSRPPDRDPTPRPQPKPKLPPRDNADTKDSKPKNPDKNA